MHQTSNRRPSNRDDQDTPVSLPTTRTKDGAFNQVVPGDKLKIQETPKADLESVMDILHLRYRINPKHSVSFMDAWSRPELEELVKEHLARNPGAELQAVFNSIIEKLMTANGHTEHIILSSDEIAARVVLTDTIRLIQMLGRLSDKHPDGIPKNVVDTEISGFIAQRKSYVNISVFMRSMIDKGVIEQKASRNGYVYKVVKPYPQGRSTDLAGLKYNKEVLGYGQDPVDHYAAVVSIKPSTQMTTVFCTKDFMIADRRSTMSAGQKHHGNIKDKTIKIALPVDRYFGNKKVVAMAGAGHSGFLSYMRDIVTNKMFETHDKPRQIKKDFQNLAICIDSSFLFLLEDGSRHKAVVNDHRDAPYSGERSGTQFTVIPEDDIIVGIGTGNSAWKVINKKLTTKNIPVHELFMYCTHLDDGSSRSFSAYSRQENILAPVITYPEDEYCRVISRVHEQIDYLSLDKKPKEGTLFSKEYQNQD